MRRPVARSLASLLLVLPLAATRVDANVSSTPGAPAFVVDGGTVVRLSGATRLTLDCDLRNFGSFIPVGGSTVVVNGYLSPVLSGVPTFADLTIASHGVASIANPVTVGGTLTLTSGWLSCGASDLVANTLSGGSAASYVMTPDSTGRLVRTVTSAAPVTFPVGNSAYDPMTIRTGTTTDVMRVAVIDAPPAVNLTPSAMLNRAWVVGGANGPGADGTITYTVQWNSGETGASFDRTIGNTTSAVAWRFLDGSWSAQPGVRVSDNNAYPAVDQLSSTATGLWTLAGYGAMLAVPAPGDAPAALALAAPSPNPLRTSTSLRYGMPRGGHVTLALYDVMGHRVATLADGDAEAGWHVATLDAGRLAGGMYFARLESCGRTQSAKLVVVK
jgi:hypothetical protein